MKYYSREVTERKPINSYGRLGYVLVTEYVKTNDIDRFNKGKRIIFTESKQARTYLYHLEANKVYKVTGEVVSRNASKYRG